MPSTVHEPHGRALASWRVCEIYDKKGRVRKRKGKKMKGCVYGKARRKGYI